MYSERWPRAFRTWLHVLRAMATSLHALLASSGSLKAPGPPTDLLPWNSSLFVRLIMRAARFRVTNSKPSAVSLASTSLATSARASAGEAIGALFRLATCGEEGSCSGSGARSLVGRSRNGRLHQ